MNRFLAGQQESQESGRRSFESWRAKGNPFASRPATSEAGALTGILPVWTSTDGGLSPLEAWNRSGPLAV